MSQRVYLLIRGSFGLGSLFVSTLLLFFSVDLEAKPNIVLIVADDLGYGDVGCYGSTLNRTPHLDRLAANGLKFTDFHSNGPMCTPTRVALLTGCYQQRFGRLFDGPLSGVSDYDKGLPLEAITIAETLREAGYVTGAFGKWHLGYHPPHMPTRQGFDEFRGLASGDGDHHTHIDRSGREDWWHDETKVKERGYTADLLTRHAVRFIECNKERPFFVYLPHLAIHFPWQGPDDPPHRVTGKDYNRDKWGLIPDRKNVHPHVKAMVEAVDASVGEIVATLEKYDLAKNTLVVFTSDNGGYLTYGRDFRNISSNGPLRGQKGDLYEGGHRVPAIFYWPGRIKPGQVSDQTVLTMDLFPTFTGLAGARVSGQKKLDGIDTARLLFEGTSLPDRTVFWRKRDLRAIRRGPWKLVFSEDEEPELYHLEKDIGETPNLAESKPTLVRQLTAAWKNWEQEMDSDFRKDTR